MKVCALSLLFAFAGFLNFDGAAAIFAKVKIVRGDYVTEDTAIAGLAWAEQRPAWLVNAPHQLFQHFEVFTTTPDYDFHGGLFHLSGAIRSHLQDRPIKAKAEIGRLNYLSIGRFVIYNHGVELNQEADGHIFIGIKGTTHIYYAELALNRNKVYPPKATIDEGPKSRIALLRELHQHNN